MLSKRNHRRFYKKAPALNRENLINSPENNTFDLKMLLLVTMHNRYNNIFLLVRQLNNILQTDDKMSEMLKKYKFIKNLRRIYFQQHQSYSVIKCNEPFCGTCQCIKVGNSFKFGNKDFIINADMYCAATYRTLYIQPYV